MVFRKPYAFLIKNFKKIHLLLLILCGFVYYKIFVLKDFIKEFISFGTYNKNLEGISTKIGFPVYFSIALIIIITISIITLLIYKKKPWKIYLIILFDYILMIYGLIAVINFFNAFTILETTTGILLPRDIVNIASLIQYPVILIIIMRITGLDLKKFKFNTDEEFLELSSQDREEFEVNIDIDKNSFKRLFNRLKRNINYVYQEHKFIINIILVILVISLIGYNYYFFGVKHKKYKQGQTYQIGKYEIKIKDVYITDKDATGNVLEKDNKFVIVKVNMKNLSESKVNPNFERFHLMNKNVNRINTIYYDDSFNDIGKGISKDNYLPAGKSKDFLLIYKVPSKLNNKKFVLYYQEYNGTNKTYPRKIKLSYNDISKITSTQKYGFGEEIKFKPLNGKSDEIIFETAEFTQNVSYSKYLCLNGGNCGIHSVNIAAKAGEKILKITFASSDYEGKEFIDFTSRYGIIKYVDNENKEHSIEVKSSVDTDYEGKEIYISVPDEAVTAKEIYIDYKIREKEYIVKIK